VRLGGSMLRQKSTLILLGGAAVAAFATWVASGEASQSSPTPAYTANVLETSYKNGEAAGSAWKLVAFRGDGSRVRIEQLRDRDGALVEMRLIDDVSRGARYVVHTGAKSVSTFPLDPQFVEEMMRPNTCEAPAPIG